LIHTTSNKNVLNLASGDGYTTSSIYKSHRIVHFEWIFGQYAHYISIKMARKNKKPGTMGCTCDPSYLQADIEGWQLDTSLGIS
jgi:hypothetical protein